MRKFFTKISVLFLALSISTSVLKAESLIVDNDTVILTTFVTLDTLIIRNNGMLRTDNIGILKYVLLESGGRLTGYTTRTWFAMDAPLIRVINNSGPDAFENVDMSLRFNSSYVTIGGMYPSTFIGFFAGFGGRDIRLENDVTVLGRFFNGYSNVVYLQGHDLILGPDCYFEKATASSLLFVADTNSRVIKYLKPGMECLIPYGENHYGYSTRVDVNLKVNPGMVMGPNAKIIMKMRANKAHPYALGTATIHYLKRYLSISFEDVTVPDISVSMRFASFDVDLPSGAAYNQMLSAVWDGTTWNYLDPLTIINQTEGQIFSECEHFTWTTGDLAAGRDLGLDVLGCYAPYDIRLRKISDTSLIAAWNAFGTGNTYKIDYKEKSAGTWNRVSPSTLLKTDTVFGLTASTNYQIRFWNVCPTNDSAVSLPIDFYTSITGYNPTTNTLRVTTLDTIPAFINYDSIFIHSGGTAVLSGDIIVNQWTEVLDGGAIYLDDYAISGASRFYGRANSTIRYSKMYLRNAGNRYYGNLRNTKTTSINAATSIILNGNVSGGDGQLIDDNFPGIVKDIVFAAKNKYTINRVLTVNGDITYNSEIINCWPSAEIIHNGSAINVNHDKADITGKLSLKGTTTTINGSYPLSVNTLVVGKGSGDCMLTLNTQLKVTGLDANTGLYLDSGQIVLNGQILTVAKISLTKGQIIGETGGKVEHLVSDYSALTIPFGTTTRGEMVSVTYNQVSGILGDSAKYIFEMVKGTPPSLGAAPVDYIKRYLNISTHNISSPVYNIKFNYTDADIVGTEDSMEVEIFDGSQWINSYRHVDSANNLIEWKNLHITGLLSAGNYLGFDEPMALNVQAKDITTDGATISWMFLDEGINTWTVNYKSLADVLFTTATVNAISTRISGLTPATQYLCFISTAETGGYDSIANSDTITFTTMAGTCNKPIGLVVSNIDTTSATLTWRPGVGDYTVYVRLPEQTWMEAKVFASVTDTSINMTGLAKERLHIVRVQSSCSENSDSIRFMTKIEGWNEVTNELYINAARTVPFDISFDKIVVDSMGDARLIADINVVDSVVVRPGGKFRCETYKVNSFVFHLMDSTFIYTQHPQTLSYIDTLGSVRSTVRNFSTRGRYIFNGVVNQQINKLYASKPGTINYITIDNPVSVTMFESNLTVGKELRIEQGKLLMHPKYYTLSMGTASYLINNSDENALNNHKIYLKISGGDEGKLNGATIKGAAVVYVDSLLQTGYDEAYIRSDVRIAHKLDLELNTYYVGIRLHNQAVLRLDTGAVLKVSSARRIMTLDTSRLQIDVRPSDVGKPFVMYVGDLGNNSPVSFTLTSGTVIDTGAYIRLAVKNVQAPETGTPTSYIRRYAVLEAHNISAPDYNASLTYVNGDIVGTESSVYNTFVGNYSFYLQQQGVVDHANNIINMAGLTEFGYITGIALVSDSTLVYPAKGAVNVDVKDSVYVQFGVTIDTINLSDILMVDTTTMDTVSGTSVLYDSAAKRLTIVHPILSYASSYEVVVPAGSVRKTGTNKENQTIRWVFTTMTRPSYVVSPLHGSTGQALDVNVSIVMPWMDISAVDFSSISITDTTNNVVLTEVSGVWDGSTTTLTINHPTFSHGITYRVTIPAGSVKVGVTQQNIEEISWIFTTLGLNIRNIELTQMDIYPNPAKDFLYIEGAEGSTIKIIDMLGKTVMLKSISDKREGINVSHLPAGVYMLQIRIKDRIKTMRVVKQ